MKRLLSLLIAVAGALLPYTYCAAATKSSVNIPVKVVVPQQLNLDVSLYRVDADAEKARLVADPTDVTNPFTDGEDFSETGMNFGELWFDDLKENMYKDPITGTMKKCNIWRSHYYFTVILVARTSGLPYKITQSCTGVVNGTSNLNKALLAQGGYESKDQLVENTDQGDLTGSDAVNKKKFCAYGSNKLIYTGATGKTRMVRCYYGLASGQDFTDDNDDEPTGSAPLTSDAAAGTYSGTITFTVALT